MTLFITHNSHRAVHVTYSYVAMLWLVPTVWSVITQRPNSVLNT